MRTTQWTLLVQTGFNDIDRRCDAYLAWLEYIRHRDAFYRSQINQIGSLTNAILIATSPADAIAIGIVAAAFGYGESLFSDYQTRIMLGYESSTIKTIVSERRLGFRAEFAKAGIRFKPDAVYVLRSYLRICMPYTITMDANTYARANAIGISARELSDPARVVDSTLSVGPLSAVDQPTGNRGDTEITITQEDPNVIALFGKKSGRSLAAVKSVQRRLCVFPSGRVEPQTRTAIAIYRRRIGTGDESGSGLFPRQGREADLFYNTTPSDCNRKKFLNTFERDEFTNDQAFRDFLGRFNDANLNGIRFDNVDGMTIEKDLSSDLNSEFRIKIANARKLMTDSFQFSEIIEDRRPHVTKKYNLTLRLIARNPQ